MNVKFLAVIAAAILLCIAGDSSALAQGKGGGKGNSGKSGNSGPGNSSSVSKSNGKGNSGKSADKANAKADKAADKADMKADKGEDKAIRAKEKAAKMSDNELNRYKGLSKKLGTTPHEMRARYEAALLRNPDLTYGNFVSAHMTADNLGDRYPNVTPDAILIGMSRGRSLGQTLQDLKVAPHHSQTTQDAIKSRMRPILGY